MTAQPRPKHHPCCNTLLRYAAGTLSPAMHMFVATHLTFCPQCRQELQTYESEAGLGLENLPPEQLDVSCLQNLLTKIDESGPIACIDVTIPITSPQAYRYPEPLQTVAGATGERIRWESSNGYRWWAIPENIASQTQIYKINHHQNVAQVSFGKQAVIMILDGMIETDKVHYHRGDIIKSNVMNGLTSGETICLVITPAKSDKPNWLQCLLSWIFGDKK